MARNQQHFDESAEMKDDRAYLDGHVAAMRAEGFDVKAVLLCGDPAEQICKHAEHDGCDLIAMATHGHKGLSDLVLGSVVNKLRHHTGIPILLINHSLSG